MEFVTGPFSSVDPKILLIFVALDLNFRRFCAQAEVMQVICKPLKNNALAHLATPAMSIA
jgi:hypothetical protein